MCWDHSDQQFENKYLLELTVDKTEDKGSTEKAQVYEWYA